jgi:hypothetical protein
VAGDVAGLDRLSGQPPRDFSVTNWFYADALLDWYQLDGFTPRFWQIAEAYFRDLAEHGQDTLYVPAFTPPLDGVKRPTQLLKVGVSGGKYRFDWSDVRTWVRLAARCGVQRFEFNHLFTQWGAANAIRIYRDQGGDERLLWLADTPATGECIATSCRSTCRSWNGSARPRASCSGRSSTSPTSRTATRYRTTRGPGRCWPSWRRG